MSTFCRCPPGLRSGRQRHVLRAGFVRPLRSNRPRQQLVDPVARVIGDALEDVAQVALRVDPVQLGRLRRSPNYAEWARFSQDSP